MATSPYVQLFVPGTTSPVKSPTWPSPVTGAPNAPMGPPTLTTAHTDPAPAVMVGWSTKRNSPRLDVSFRLGMVAIFAITSNVRPPSVLRAMGRRFSVSYRYAKKRLP